MIADLRQAVRALSRSPGFTLVGVVTLALGIGANTAVFSVVNGVLLRALPYPGPDRLVRLSFHPPDDPDPPYRLMSFPDYQDIAAASGWLEESALFGNARPTLTGAGEPQVLFVARVTASAIPLLGVVPAAGRAIEPADDRPGAPPVVMLGHAFWQRRFGGDRGVVGRSITLDGSPVTVIGVLPLDMVPPADLQLGWVRDAWTPLGPYVSATDRRGYRFSMYARLRHGVTPAQVRQDLESIGNRLAEAYPESNRGVGFLYEDAREQLVQGSRSLLLVIMAAVALVLLIACANVANLLVARGTARRRDIAIRHSIGASGFAIARHALAESVVLGLAGGVLGLALAWCGLRWLGDAAATRIPRLAQVRVDSAVLAMTAATALGTALVAGLLPVIEALRGRSPEWLLRGGERRGAGRRTGRVRATLLTAQVAATVPLLVGAGLLLNSFWRLSHVPTGFEVRDLLTVTVGLNSPSYSNPAAVTRFYDDVLERVGALPGVRSAGATTQLPLNGGAECVRYQVDRIAETRGDCAEIRVTTGGYADALQVPLLAGRYFDDGDRADSRPVAVVSRALAERLWPGREALGQEIRIASDPEPWRTVVGVVGDVRHKTLARPEEPELHVPLRQSDGPRFMTLAVRTIGSQPLLPNAIRRAVWVIDPEIPVPDAVPMATVVGTSISLERLRALLLGLCGVVGLLLTVVGIYGVAAFLVGERRQEIGVRLALGAAPERVRRMVLRQSLTPVLVGLAPGALVAWGAGRAVSRFLFGVTPTDLPTLAAIAAVVVVAAWAGTVGPVRRASRVDPVESLRCD